MDLSEAPPAGWVPGRIDGRATPPVVDWCWIGARRLADPFFDQTVGDAMRHPFAAAFRPRTPLDALRPLAPPHGAPEPSGFVFHVSRCGSTLVAQALAALPEHAVISEAPALDALLRGVGALAAAPEADRVAWLRGAVGALARRTAPAAGRVFVKLDSWHVGEIGLVRRAFPHVPWIFVYRDPVEVLASHARRRGAHMVAGLIEPERFGLALAEAAAMDADEYGARVLGDLCRKGLAALALGGGRLVAYDELPAALWTALGRHFGIAWSEADVARMQQAARQDAKNPVVPFADDRAHKQREAPPALRAAVERHARAAYEALERARRERSPSA